jgi:hypothetical protein
VKLYRIPTDPYVDLLSKYGHPNGWRIIQRERDYSLRGFPRGAIGGTEHTAPKRWWEVYRAHSRRARTVETFRTLREARAWCDENKAHE